MGRGRLPSIQVLRGVAALAVVVHHAVATMNDRPTLAGPPSGNLITLTSLGASGVDLFFVISGFVMAHVSERLCERGAMRFMVDRMIRILPMFWLMSASYIGWMLFCGASFPPAAYLNTLFVLPLAGTDQFPALYVGWTLSFELTFYIVAASVIATRTAQPARWLAIVMATAATLGLFPRLHAIAPLLLNPISGEFALGATAWLIRDSVKLPTSPLTVVLLGALLIAQTIVNPWAPDFSIHPTFLISGATSLRRLVFWGLPCFMIVLAAALATSSDGWGMRCLDRLGDASYSIYLGHPLAFQLLIYALPSGRPFGQLLLGATMVAVALAFGLIVHALLERPLLKAMRNGRSRLEHIGDGRRRLSPA